MIGEVSNETINKANASSVNYSNKTTSVPNSIFEANQKNDKLLEEAKTITGGYSSRFSTADLQDLDNLIGHATDPEVRRLLVQQKEELRQSLVQQEKIK